MLFTSYYEFSPTSSASSSPSSASSSWWASHFAGVSLKIATLEVIHRPCQHKQNSNNLILRQPHQTLSPYHTSGISCIIITAVPFSGTNSSPKSGTSSSTLASVGRCYRTSFLFLSFFWLYKRKNKNIEAKQYHLQVFFIHVQHIPRRRQGVTHVSYTYVIS